MSHNFFSRLDKGKNKKRTKNLIFENEQYTGEALTEFKAGLSVQKSSQNEDMIRTGIVNEVISIETNTIKEEKNEESTKNTEESEKILIKDITEKIDIDKNADLFKAVFLSSDEEESDKEEENDVEKNKRNEDKVESNRTDEEKNISDVNRELINKEEKTEIQLKKTEIMKQNVLSDLMLPKIQPMKEGILSNVDFSLFSQNSTSNVHIVNQSTEEKIDVECSYGPKLPQNLTGKIKVTGPQVSNVKKTSSSSFNFLNFIDPSKMKGDGKRKSSSSEDEWVEKGKNKRKDKKKKHAKDKGHKKKKHKRHRD